MAKKKAKNNKKQSKKIVYRSVLKQGTWNVVTGKLKSGPGRPGKDKPVFSVVAEKIPFIALTEVKKDMLKYGALTDGVYFAHDSMGVPRYGGRGQIFKRLAKHRRKHPLELLYFSFYIIEAKNHEREIETAILRAAGPQMILNTRKVSQGIDPGDVRDYEPGTDFYERQRIRGKKTKKKR
ncbi:MAG: hypothetical protein PHU85_09985 [Phycisphaerae bacterium]|nr:hypothetical protein [Phycisphaerae bacterium]